MMINTMPFRLTTGDMIVVSQSGGVRWDTGENGYVPAPRWNLTFRVVRPLERDHPHDVRRAYCEEWHGQKGSISCPVEHTRPATPSEVRLYEEMHAAGWSKVQEWRRIERAAANAA